MRASQPRQRPAAQEGRKRPGPSEPESVDVKSLSGELQVRSDRWGSQPFRRLTAAMNMPDESSLPLLALKIKVDDIFIRER